LKLRNSEVHLSIFTKFCQSPYSEERFGSTTACCVPDKHVKLLHTAPDIEEFNGMDKATVIRYEIRNLERQTFPQGRYINEQGTFSADEEAGA